MGMSSISDRDLASSSKGLEYAEMTATTLETESSGSKIVPNVDAGSIISDTERSDDGKESGKEIRKIQTTTTTQVSYPLCAQNSLKTYGVVSTKTE